MLWNSNATENDNFAVKVISKENVEGENSILKKIVAEVTRKNQLIFFQVIILGD